MTPFDLELLLHFYYSPDLFPKHDTHAFTGAVKKLQVKGLLDFRGDVQFELSDKGRCFVKMLLATPLPKQIWADPREQEKP